MSLMTVAQASLQYGIPLRTLYHHVKKGTLQKTEFDGLPVTTIFVTGAAMDRFIANTYKRALGRPRKTTISCITKTSE